MNVFLFYNREEGGCTRRENRTGSRGIRKRNQEEEREEDCEEEEEGQEEEVRRGLSHKRYASSCIIENTSLTFY